MFFVSVKKKIRLLSIYWKRKFSFAHFFSSLVNRKNAKRYAFVAGLFFLVIASATSLFFYQQFRTPESSSSPEVGFSSLSPSGSLGGEILPASCESNPGHCIQSSCDKNGCYCTAYEVVNCCVPNQGQACTSSANACGQTQSNGSIQCNGSCSSTPPANPPGYGNACTGATSSPNACGQTNPGGAGTIQCNGSCSGATGSTPANPPWLGVGCTSAPNSCGQTNSGTYNCAGTCSASTPANPAGYGNACSSAPNACGQTQSNGSIQCNGSCSSTPPANPPGYGNACTSSTNSCGQTQSNGTIQCNSSCSSTPPADPWYLGVGCTSVANSCGQTNSGTYNCAGTCSASTPANPPGYGNACTSSANACGQTQSNGSIQCNGSCSSTPPANPPGYGNACTGATSSPNACGQTSPGGAGSIQCNGSCSGATGSTPANPPWLGVGCSSAANACGQTNSGTYNCAGTCSASTPPNSACPAPTLAFSANPVTIVSGNSSTLTWTPTNAASCWAWGGGIDGWKTPTGGNQVVSPATTTTYFMECWNSASVSSGVKQAAVNVTVPLPTVDLKINGSNGPLNLTQGATKNISWTTANAASCTASSSDGFSGSKSVPTGEESVIANVTSNHTLTCLNSLGNGNSDSVQVNVSCSQSCGAWSACSVACGGGTQTRSCTNTSCLPYVEPQDCNTSACGDYNWKEVAP